MDPPRERMLLSPEKGQHSDRCCNEDNLEDTALSESRHDAAPKRPLELPEPQRESKAVVLGPGQGQEVSVSWG